MQLRLQQKQILARNAKIFITMTPFKMGREGFEPSKDSANRFTVCPL